MPIGDGPDIEQFNREEEKEVKLGDEVEDWWGSLSDNYKYELLETYYDIDVNINKLNEEWEELSWNDRWDIFREANGFAKDYE